MALIIHTSVTFPSMSGFTRDNVVNTFTHAFETDADVAALTGLEAALTDFYNAEDTGGSGLSVSQLIGPQISRTAPPIFRHYGLDGHLSGGRVGSPIRVQPMALIDAPVAGGPMPSEVAVALSYHSDFTTDVEFGAGATRPRARDRGRIYIGPLAMSALIVHSDTGGNRPTVAPNIRQTLLSAGLRLRTAEGGGGVWSVWSRANGTVRGITEFSVDDAFDTQRRRGERAVTRQVLAV
jgi:hypothetical protein